MQPTTAYAPTMLAAGIGIPVLAALNAGLGTRLASPVAAAAMLFTIALAITLVILALKGAPALSAIVTAPKHLFLAGVLVAFYILSITIIAPKFGVGNAVFFVLLGQLISAALIDHVGLVGARISPLSPARAGGIALMAAGVFLTQKV